MHQALVVLLVPLLQSITPAIIPEKTLMLLLMLPFMLSTLAREGALLLLLRLQLLLLVLALVLKQREIRLPLLVLEEIMLLLVPTIIYWGGQGRRSCVACHRSRGLMQSAKERACGCGLDHARRSCRGLGWIRACSKTGHPQLCVAFASLNIAGHPT